MPLFTFKSKSKSRKLPVDEIVSMRSSGISDKDIIKKLKEMGYSYDEIEKAMIESLKGEVSPATETLMQAKPDAPEAKTAEPSVGEIYEEKPEETESDIPPETIVEPSSAVGLFDEGDAELSIEELVEGVVNEKWEIFEKELRNIKYDYEKMIKELDEMRKAIYRISEEKKNPEIERKLMLFDRKIENIDARVSGLEKAFKQFLPSLIQNIRTLSELVNKMKEKSESTFSQKFSS